MDKVLPYAQCPYCKCDIDYIEQISIDFDDIYCFVNWEGFCPQCQRTFIFSEDYKLTDRRFLTKQQ